MNSFIENFSVEREAHFSPTPFVILDKVIGHYQVKTATTNEELKCAFKLRHDIFFREFAGIQYENSIEHLDIEDHDYLCDHLIVKDLRSGEVIACYRLLSSKNLPLGSAFYSESEFKIDDFLNTKDNKLELGRACVHKDYRRGTVVLLLWRGIIEYATNCQTRYLFGCSSISHDQFPFIPEILREISIQDKFIDDWPIDVCEKYLFDTKKLDFKLCSVKAHNSLMQIYLNAGAKVGRELAYDSSLNCVDLFTLLDFNLLPAIFKKGLSD